MRDQYNITSHIPGSGRLAQGMDLWDLKKWRRLLRLSQFAAAAILGVSRGAHRHPSSPYLHRCCVRGDNLSDEMLRCNITDH